MGGETATSAPDELDRGQQCEPNIQDRPIVFGRPAKRKRRRPNAPPSRKSRPGTPRRTPRDGGQKQKPNPRESPKTPRQLPSEAPDRQRERTERICRFDLKRLEQSLNSAWIKRNKPFPQESNTQWDGHTEYFMPLRFGECKQPCCGKIEKPAAGVEIKRDIGVTFYKVIQGDTLERIGNKLSKLPEFKYLKDLPDYGLRSFNFPNPRDLKGGMWIPIPLPETQRQMTEKQFINYCYEATQEMLRHPAYGQEMRRIVNQVGFEELYAAMWAVAKTESGGKPFGQFEYHRWEEGSKCFSYGMFHVLMSGPGLRARRRLDMTEGQTYHPKNGAKLFLAFCIEKARESNVTQTSNGKGDVTKLFPMGSHYENWATFFNSSLWRKTNPNYASQLTAFHKQAKNFLSGCGINWNGHKTKTFAALKPLAAPEKPPSSQPIEMHNGLGDAINRATESIGDRDIRREISSKKTQITTAILTFIKRKFFIKKPITGPSTPDKISVGKDHIGIFIEFSRYINKQTGYQKWTLRLG